MQIGGKQQKILPDFTNKHSFYKRINICKKEDLLKTNYCVFLYKSLGDRG